MKTQGPYCALVVDDHEDTAESFAKVLHLLGCKAVFVIDPRNALAEARRVQPHVAFLDIGMPHINGRELARTLRAAFGEDLRLIAVTAYGGAHDRAASRRAGFDAHVVKPVDPALVESILKTMFPAD